MQKNTWYIKIHISDSHSLIDRIGIFQDSGFDVTEIPYSMWHYILRHTSKHAMTLYMLTHDCTCFTVTLEETL
jgi:hypothetical protein